MAATRKINYPATRASPVKPPRPPDEAKLERDLRAVMRRKGHTEKLDSEAGAERDRVIRDAHAAGMKPSKIAEITGLTTKRIDQIRRGSRL